MGYVKDDRGAIPIDPAPQLPNFNMALDLAGLGEPIDVGTQNARKQLFPLETFQIIDNLTWLKGSHTVQSGFNIRLMHEEDFRNDKVVGSLSIPVAQVGAGTFNPVPRRSAPVSSFRPTWAGTTNSTDLSWESSIRPPTWRPATATCNRLPVGTGLITESNLQAYEFYAADTWRMSPTFTLNLGVTYNWQTPPLEKDGHQTLLTFRDSGELVDAMQYLSDKRAASERGEIYNPTLAYVPIRETGRKHAFDTDWTNISPRISAAWTPSFSKGWSNRIFGDGKTVIRGGYSRLYDRTPQSRRLPSRRSVLASPRRCRLMARGVPLATRSASGTHPFPWSRIRPRPHRSCP